MVEQKIELPKEAAILSHFSACSEEPEAEKKVKILKALPGVQDLFNVVDDMARVLVERKLHIKIMWWNNAASELRRCVVCARLCGGRWVGWRGGVGSRLAVSLL